MRSIRWGRMAWFTVVWAVLVSLTALVFLAREFDGDSPTITVDVGLAQSKLALMQTPGPWNGGQAWSREKVDSAMQREYQVFWPEVWVDARPYILGAMVALLAGVGGIALTSRRGAPSTRITARE